MSTLTEDTARAAQDASTCDALVAESKVKSAKKREQLLAECKASTGSGAPAAGGGIQTMAITYNSAYDNCVDSTKTLCASQDVHRIAKVTFFTSASTDLTVKTESLVGIAGSTPDTVLYVVHCDTSACAAGDLLAIDDDDNGSTDSNRDSEAVITSPPSGWYAVFVTAFSHSGHRGTADIVVSQSGGVNTTWTDQVFSVWQIDSKELRTGDILLAAKNPEADSMQTAGFENYHDSLLLAVSNASLNCDGSCGRAQFQDDTYFGTGATTYMSRMTIGSALGSPTAAKVFVGVYANGTAAGGEYYRMNARVAHMRRSTGDGGAWTGGAPHWDADGDGLTAEVESQLGTCDDASTAGTDVVVSGWGCADVKAWMDDQVNDLEFGGSTVCGNSSDPRCWTARDSDQDGIEDSHELFALLVGCGGGPSGPYREATGCERPNPIVGGCGGGDWCRAEPAYGNLDSPFFGQDPTVYDIFVEADYLRSTDANIEAAHQHALSTAQQTELRELWGEEPNNCWDGAATGTCPGATDLRYRVNMHAYPGQSWPVVDDRAQEEIVKGGGHVFARSHYYATANTVLRHYGALRFGFALHQPGNGISDYNQVFQWGNRDQTDHHARRPFSHEVGHSFDLYHRHRPPEATQDETSCGTPPTQSPCSWCEFDTSACTPALPNHSCSASAPQTAADVTTEDPATPTLMSYQLRKMYPIQSAPPTSTTPNSVCTEFASRFSKGLLGRILNETQLDNSWQPSAGVEEWQLRHLAQSMICYDGAIDCRGRGSFAPLNSGGVPFGPYCDVSGGSATTCYFNWNGQTAQPTDWSTSLSDTDITAGRWNRDPNVQSNRETLEDADEWAKMISLGRRDLGSTVGRGMCLYANTFNGPQVNDDFCGWGETITADGGMTAFDVNYPMGGCRLSTDCVGSGAACVADPSTCSTNSDCLSGVCSNGYCACTGADPDLKCRSGQCVAGLCVTGWGSCSCLTGADCPGQAIGTTMCTTSNRCVSARPATAVVPPASEGGQPWALLASAAFDGTDDRIRLHGGTDSRLEGLSGSFENQYALHFDFRFDGFQGSETEHVLFQSGAFRLRVVSGGQVEATVGGHTALVWSGLQRGRWYRAIWSAGKAAGDHFLWLRRMDPTTGWYADPGDGGGGACVYQSWTYDLTSPGDVWIGHDCSSDTSRYFHGRLDNVALVNFRPTARPAACTLQQ